GDAFQAGLIIRWNWFERREFPQHHELPAHGGLFGIHQAALKLIDGVLIEGSRDIGDHRSRERLGGLDNFEQAKATGLSPLITIKPNAIDYGRKKSTIDHIVEGILRIGRVIDVGKHFLRCDIAGDAAALKIKMAMLTAVLGEADFLSMKIS